MTRGYRVTVLKFVAQEVDDPRLPRYGTDPVQEQSFTSVATITYPTELFPLLVILTVINSFNGVDTPENKTVSVSAPIDSLVKG
jgi:hypothetical protein